MKMYTRDELGLRPPRRTVEDPGTDNVGIVVHHTAGSRPSTTAACIPIWKGIQNYHMDTQGWFDVAYNFAITPEGDFFEGRGMDHQSGATRGFNESTWAVVFFGNFQNHELTEAEVNAFIGLRSQIVGRFPNASRLLTHRQAAEECNCGATACPGDNVVARVPDLTKLIIPEPDPPPQENPDLGHISRILRQALARINKAIDLL